MKLGRLLALLLCVAMLLVTMGAVSFAEGDELTYKGTITFYAQAYTPQAESETVPYPRTAFKTVAEQYQALHPDITIEFLDQLAAGQDYATWLKTKMAGGQAPDIVWLHASQINTNVYPEGSTVELSEYLARPNKYIEGNASWLDTFPASVIAANRGPNGEQPVINADYVGTAVYYNKELFEKAGVAMPEGFVTWKEYTDICDKLLAAGITPWAFSFGNNADDTAYITWFTRLFNTNAYRDMFEELAVIDPAKHTLNAAEVYVAFKNGQFGVDNPRWMAWWELMKEQIDKYMPEDAISAASTRDTVFSQFTSGKIAMMWDGSWAPNNFRDASVEFEIGSFPFPYTTTDSTEYSSNYNSAACVGGPYAAFQYAITSPKANSTMTDEKLAACVDWLMFSTTPENDSLICNDNGSFIPTVIGSVPSESNSGLVQLLQADDYVVDDGILSLGSAFNDLYYRTFQQYCRGDITLDEAKEALRMDLDDAVNAGIDSLDIDIAPYIK